MHPADRRSNNPRQQWISRSAPAPSLLRQHWIPRGGAPAPGLLCQQWIPRGGGATPGLLGHDPSHHRHADPAPPTPMLENKFVSHLVVEIQEKLSCGARAAAAPGLLRQQWIPRGGAAAPGLLHHDPSHHRCYAAPRHVVPAPPTSTLENKYVPHPVAEIQDKLSRGAAAPSLLRQQWIPRSGATAPALLHQQWIPRGYGSAPDPSHHRYTAPRHADPAPPPSTLENKSVLRLVAKIQDKLSHGATSTGLLRQQWVPRGSAVALGLLEKLEKKRVLADAFDISTPNMDALYLGDNSVASDLLADYIRREPKWVVDVEELMDHGSPYQDATVLQNSGTSAHRNNAWGLGTKDGGLGAKGSESWNPWKKPLFFESDSWIGVWSSPVADAEVPFIEGSSAVDSGFGGLSSAGQDIGTGKAPMHEEVDNLEEACD